jgi:isocitrate/isopropylmalate dehydrogenase
VDALALELVREPSRFEVIVTNNLYGDILSDLGAGLVGGLGIAASANLHPGRRGGLFEPVLERAVKQALTDGARTPDLGGRATTQEVASAIFSRVSATESFP